MVIGEWRRRGRACFHRVLSPAGTADISEPHPGIGWNMRPWGIQSGCRGVGVDVSLALWGQIRQAMCIEFPITFYVKNQ